MSERLVKAWYQGSPWLVLLWPLSLLYRGLSALRAQLYKYGLLKQSEFPIPIIVVGNITVGGTGKTPLTLQLIEFLKAQGFKPAVVSRGYGGNTEYPALVTHQSSAAHVGDEPLLLALRAQVPVVVDPIRPRAVSWLLANTDCDVVLSDDGLQHYALGRDIELCVIDGERGLGNRQILPMGPLREPPSRLNSVDFIIANGATAAINSAHVMTLAAGQWVALANAHNVLPEVGSRIHAVAGIGNPERFFNTLRMQGFDVIPHAFPDHYSYQATDFVFSEALPIVMTEKDAVKCRDFIIPMSWYVPVTAELPASFLEALLNKLRSVSEKKTC